MERQYVMVVDALRQRIKINVKNQGHPVQNLPPKKVTGSVETFSYRFGKLGLIDPEIVDFHRRLSSGNKETEKLWTVLNEHSDGGKELRQNVFTYDMRDSFFGMTDILFSGKVLSRDEIPILFYDREKSYMFDGGHGRNQEPPLEKYFVADFKESEIVKIEGEDFDEVYGAMVSVHELSGEQVAKSEIGKQWRMLERYSAQMLPPYEVCLEVTEREISKKEAKKKANFERRSIESHRRSERQRHIGPGFWNMMVR